MKSNVLYILGFTFAALAFSKAGNIAMASASVNDPSQAAISDSSPVDSASLHDDQASTEQDMCITGVLAQTLKAQKQSLDDRQIEISEREAALTSLEKRVEDQILEVQAVESSIRQYVDVLERTANNDVGHLVQMYETMKPKSAASIFNQMDPAFAAGFLRQINGAKAGLILADMDARNSYKVSLIMAEQHASWRKSE